MRELDFLFSESRESSVVNGISRGDSFSLLRKITREFRVIFIKSAAPPKLQFCGIYLSLTLHELNLILFAPNLYCIPVQFTGEATMDNRVRLLFFSISFLCILADCKKESPTEALLGGRFQYSAFDTSGTLSSAPPFFCFELGTLSAKLGEKQVQQLRHHLDRQQTFLIPHKV